MASIKGGLLDRLRPRRKNFTDLRLGAVCASLIVISLVFLCSNYPSKKTFLLRPNFSAVVPDSSVIDDAITPANLTLLTNLSLSLEIKESETLAARSAESFNRSLENLEMDAGNWSFHGRDESVNLGILLADRRKIGNSSDIGEIPLSYYSTQLAKKGDGDLPVQSCDIFDGKWVRDDSKPYYPPESCPYIDEGFNCFLNGRPDDEYVKWRWQPNGCNLPRLNATDFLERLKGKKVVFVGDSLNRNMWESLVCILHHSVRDKKRVYEISGRTEFKKKGIYAFRFEEYNCSIDFVASPFLVRESLHSRENRTFETLRLDLMDRTTSMYQDADILIFNTGHWWTHDKTSKGEDYYQEGDYVHPRLKVLQAYEKALTTWGKWVDEHVDTNKTLVFFRGYSITHFRGGQWNSGGQCHRESEPIFNETYLGKYPSKMRALEKVLKTMKTRVIYLNISRMTDHRKDGHPSIYRKAYNTAQERLAAEQTQDCSHWCLPGVPDTWNALLYASLVGVENRAPRSAKN